MPQEGWKVKRVSAAINDVDVLFRFPFINKYTQKLSYAIYDNKGTQ